MRIGTPSIRSSAAFTSALRRGARGEDPPGGSLQRKVAEGCFHKLRPWPTGRPMYGANRNGTETVRVDCPIPPITTHDSGS